MERDRLNRLSLYLVTGREYLPGGTGLVDALERALEAGVRAVQLREKDLPARDLYPLALELRRLTSRFGALLLVNDRIDVAMAAGADGVHLAGHSLPPGPARAILGKDKLIGVSTHHVEEIVRAREQGADFVTFGPVYHTPSKARYGRPRGTDALREACKEGGLPVIAIGGINARRVKEVLSAGASGIGLISAILASRDPGAAARRLLHQCRASRF